MAWNATVMSYVVTTQLWPGRLIAAVQVRIVRSQIPVEFMRHLDQVYAAKASGLALDGQNVFVYSGVTGQPDLLDCAFGVGVAAPFEPIGNVRPLEIPSGEVATTTHVGPYSGLPAANQAVKEWCARNQMKSGGLSWEVYGHWREGEPPRTDVYYLLR